MEGARGSACSPGMLSCLLWACPVSCGFASQAGLLDQLWQLWLSLEVWELLRHSVAP